MKTPALLTIALIIILTSLSCSKHDESPGPSPTVIGTWNVTTDSTYTTNTDSTNNVKYNLAVYHGEAGDYFTFTNKGMLYYKEAGLGYPKDTAAYSLASSNVMDINFFFGGGNGGWTINTLNDHHLVIRENPDALLFTPPSSLSGETINLER
jgi:hypothetical protein